MSEPRPMPGMTVEEMTRRRDNWRQKAERMSALYARELIRARDAERKFVQVRNNRNAWVRRAEELEKALVASQAEARRYAEELGALRTQLSGE